MSATSGIGYENYASGKAIYSAADNPAGLVIAEGMQQRERGYDKGVENASAGKDMINTADSSLNEISSSLNRIRELSVQAMNSATMSSEDIIAIQDEVEALKQGIQDAAKGTQYNKISITDNENEYNLVTNPDGKGSSIKMVNATLDSLGIADYDVTGNFDISKIDKAIEKVTSGRSKLGAQSNGLDHTIASNQVASQEVMSSRSKLEDLDYAKASTEINKKDLIAQYKVFLQRKQADYEKQLKTSILK